MIEVFVVIVKFQLDQIIIDALDYAADHNGPALENLTSALHGREVSRTQRLQANA